MILQIFLQFALQFVLPIFYCWRILRIEFPDKFSWLNAVLQALALAVFATFIGRWDLFSRYLRLLPLALVVMAAVVSFFQSYKLPNLVAELHRPWWRVGLQWLETLLISVLAVAALLGLQSDETGFEMNFPLEAGRYQIVQGGDSRWLNGHRPNAAQAYAVDIVALDDFGRRAQGIFPERLDAYQIFGEQVLSPCEGHVTETQDGFPDLQPPARDPENPAGNHVVIQCQRAKVLLAHLQEGSVRVEEGQFIEEGELLGNVGNTGNTTEPHLHVHAVKSGSSSVMEGSPVPINFDNRFPVRNQVIRH